MKLKMLPFLLCTVFILSFSACSENNVTPSSSPDQKTEATQNPQESDTPDNTNENSKKPGEDTELPQLSELKQGETIAVMTTNFGVIKMRFFPEYAPKAVENFITHAKDGYYNGLIFHRVIEDFVIQGGDPTGTGTGGESIWGEPFESEITPSLHHIRGALAMAKSSLPVSNGSQFYIVSNKGLDEGWKQELQKAKEDLTQPVGKDANGNDVPVGAVFPERILDKYISDGGVPSLDLQFEYTVFGQVIEGMDVVDKISEVEVIDPANENHKPVNDVIIEKIEITEHN